MSYTAKTLPVTDLKPSPRNARTHSEGQIAKVRRLIEQFGWTNPILYDFSVPEIVAGHCRREAAVAIYDDGGTIRIAPGTDDAPELPAGTVPVIDCTGWSEDQRRAYMIADNASALDAGWDLEILKGELLDIGNAGFDLSLTALDDSEIATVMAYGVGRGDPESVPDEPAEPVSQPGDLWRLGDHVLVCGDCTDRDVAMFALDGASPHLMVTDQPYGVEYDPTARRSLQSRNAKPAQGAVTNDDRDDWREAWAHFPGDVAYVWHAGIRSAAVENSLAAHAFEPRAQIVWIKNKMVVGRSHYHWRHEPLLYAVRKGANGHWQGGRKQTTVWEIDKPVKSETGHSTQKPVEAMQRPIENNSEAGDHVYDPFVGSGTTIIAATMAGRVCHAVELNPAYVDIAVLRWQDFTGEEATDSEGRSFAEVKAERFG